jgi:hypothetical protein
MFAVDRRGAACVLLVPSVALLLGFQVACGPEDYQKPIKDFQDASSIVITATEAFLNNMNTIEQNKLLDEMVFERKPLNLSELDSVEIISPEEIRLRTEALSALSQYTANLGALASGSAGSAVADSTKKCSSSLKDLADDAKKLPGAKGTPLASAKFSGLAGAAATAIGAVAQLMVEKKARREIADSVVENDAAVTALIEQIRTDATLAYERQRNQLGEYGDELAKDYSDELKRNPDPILMLSFTQTVKAYRTQQSQLKAANPAEAIDKMSKAHRALVAYVKSNKNPTTFGQLVTGVQQFENAARLLNVAIPEKAAAK